MKVGGTCGKIVTLAKTIGNVLSSLFFVSTKNQEQGTKNVRRSKGNEGNYPCGWGGNSSF